MTVVSILPESQGTNGPAYRAVSGEYQSLGRTAGEALDALTAQLGADRSGTLVVVQHMQPDRFFTAAQQQRLQELMDRWRTACDAGAALPPAEQAELEALVEAEVEAAARRAEALTRGLTP
jgi:hypothetical protein